MTGFDYAVITVLLISLLVGVKRGLVYEVLSLLGWPLAFAVSKQFAMGIAPMMPGEETMRAVLAYALVFVAVLIIWVVTVRLLSKLIKAAGLGWIDGTMGALFGLLRGALVILLLVWLAGLTRFPEQPFWRDAQTSRAAEDVALWSKVWLPDNIGRRIHYGIRS